MKTAIKERSFYPTPHELSAIDSGRLSLVLRPIEAETKIHKVVPNKHDKRTECWGYKLKNGNWQDLECDGLGRITKECPYGVTGDRLLLKETFACDLNGCSDGQWEDNKSIAWRSPITMPKEAVRFTLEIASVQAMQIQDVTEDLAVEWGIHLLEGDRITYPAESKIDRAIYRDGLIRAWNKVNPDRPYSENPWVWAIAVRRVEA